MTNNKKALAGILEFPCDVERLKNGNTLITDAGDETGQGSEIIEVNSQGEIVWRFADGLKFAHSAKRLKNGNTLISDTTNNRVLEVDANGDMLFSSENWANGTGKLSDGSHLHYPNDAHQLNNGNILITDRNNNRCVIVDRKGNVKWLYDNGLRHPHNCDPLENGNILIADSDGNRIIEVNHKKEIVWEYGANEQENILQWPRDADKTKEGNVLITDSKNSRIIEVNTDGEIVWEYKVDYFSNFYDADKLDNGNILIADQQHHQVIEVDNSGDIVWKFKNYQNGNNIYSRIKNGSFKKKNSSGLPEDWILYNRFAEGGGCFEWDKDKQGRDCPVIELDRPGVFCLQQTVEVKPGRTYRMAGKIRTENIGKDSFGYLQMAFLDSEEGLVEDAAKAPKGRLFDFDTDWVEDSFQAVAPKEASSVELRITICGQGRMSAKNIMFFG